MFKKGKLILEQRVTTTGDDFLSCTLKSFDTNDYYMNIFKENEYNADSILYEKALSLNGQSVMVEFLSLSRFKMNDPIDINPVNELGSDIDIEEYKNIFRNQLKSFEISSYKNFLNNIFKRSDVSTKFWDAPASEKDGYCYKGGLLHKTVNLLNMIDSLSHYLLENIEFNIELLKVLAITTHIGKINAYEFNMNTIERSIDGKNFSDKELSTHLVIEELSKENSLTPDEKNIIIHSALREDTIKGRSDVAKRKETMVLTTFNYLDDMISSFVILKKNKLNEEQFMTFNNQELYTGDL